MANIHEKPTPASFGLCKAYFSNLPVEIPLEAIMSCPWLIHYPDGDNIALTCGNHRIFIDRLDRPTCPIIKAFEKKVS